MASVLVAPWLLACVAWVRIDPFAFAHVVARLAIPALLLAVVVALAFKRFPAGRWLLPIFIAGYLLRGVGLFHPTSFYPDVQNARRYALALAEGAGSLAERGRAAQVALNVAYPRFIAGKPYAFPYSPLAYLPFAVFRNPDVIEDAFRQGGLIAAALEIPLIFMLAYFMAVSRRSRAAEPPTATALSGDRQRARLTAILAALVALFLPSSYSRLLLAMSATLIGHFWDVCLIVTTLLYLRRPDRRRWLVAMAASAGVSLLTYVSSLFTVSLFLVMLAILARKQAPRLLAILTGAILVPLLWLYAPFLREFVTEILPAVFNGAKMAGTTTATPGLLAALRRIPLFYGYGCPALAIAGFVLIWRRADSRTMQVVTAYTLAFLALVGLRAFGGGLFRDLKEITFVGPLMASLSAVAIAEIARMRRSGRVAAIMIVLGLAWFGMSRYRFYLETYASPFLRVQEAAAVITGPRP